MGKNVFSQINDMFIQKEVATLFRSSAASKFQRKKENKGAQIEDGPLFACYLQSIEAYGLHKWLYVNVLSRSGMYQGCEKRR